MLAEQRVFLQRRSDTLRRVIKHIEDNFQHTVDLYRRRSGARLVELLVAVVKEAHRACLRRMGDRQAHGTRASFARAYQSDGEHR